MAWETGSATNHVDLFNKIRDFLTTNTELVNAGENWEQVLGSTDPLSSTEIITLRGPGLAGNDNIYCGLRLGINESDDIYNLQLWGHAGFSETLAPRDQPLMSYPIYVPLWNQPMTYWLIGNGRRWMLAVKVSTVYSSAYCGFMLPYAAPSEYPYPMVVAGISYDFVRWSSTSGKSSHFADPGYESMMLYYPDNVWRTVGNYNSNGSDAYGSYWNNDDSAAFVFPTRHYDASGDLRSTSNNDIMHDTDKCFDGSYLLRDLILISSVGGRGNPENVGPYRAMMGVLDGAYWIPGRENSAENIVAFNGKDHLVVQNLFRTDFRDYMALRLE